MSAPRPEYEELFWQGEGFERKLTFYDYHYMTDIEVPFSRKDEVKGIPGVRMFKDAKGRWLTHMPIEVARHFGYANPIVTANSSGGHLPLLPFQVAARDEERAHYAECGFVVEHATGLGKTATAIDSIASSPEARTLAIVPAVVVPNWHREFLKWGVSEENTTITSWHTLHKVADQKFDKIVADELHNAKNPRAKMSEAFGRLRLGNPKTPILGLTATFIMKEAIDLWHPLHVLFPGRFGTYWQFARRYCNLEHSEHGVSVSGLNPQHASELRWRLDSIAHQCKDAPKARVIPLMRYVKKPRIKDLKEVFRRSTTTKIDSCVELFQERAEEGKRKFVVMAHYRETARQIAAALSTAGFKVWHTSGEHSIEVRDGIIEEWKKAEEGVLVCTIFSVKEGIRLSGAECVCYLELVWSPGRAVQSLGRFSDLSMAGQSVLVYFTVVENSLEERQAAVLARRIEEQNAVRGDDQQSLDTKGVLVVQHNETEVLAELSALEIPDLDFDEAEL